MVRRPTRAGPKGAPGSLGPERVGCEQRANGRRTVRRIVQDTNPLTKEQP